MSDGSAVNGSAIATPSTVTKLCQYLIQLSSTNTFLLDMAPSSLCAILLATCSIVCSKSGETFDGPSSPSDWQSWIDGITAQRTKDLSSINYNGSIFDVPDLDWTQSSFIVRPSLPPSSSAKLIQMYIGPLRCAATPDARLRRLFLRRVVARVHVRQVDRRPGDPLWRYVLADVRPKLRF